MRYPVLLLVALAAAAPAAERKLFVSSFDRVRVDGPFRVIVTAGRSPSGVVSGDPRQLDRVEVRQEGATVSVRPNPARAEEPARGVAAQPIVVTLTTPALAAASLIGSGAVSVTGMKGPRVDLSVAGTGTLAVTGADATELSATSIGSGRLSVVGRTVKARLLVNGSGGVDAARLAADALTVRLDGPGEIAATARFTADVVSTGLGRVAVTGPAKCSVKAVAGGPVTCGAGVAK